MKLSGLFDVIDAHRKREFAWNGDYCALFVARGLDAMHGTQFETSLLLKFDEGSAKRFAVAGDMVSAVSEYLGPPIEDRARRGDVVTVDAEEGEALGFCLGSRVVVMGAGGLRYLPRSAIKKVWRWARS